jgi:RNA polymerase sigma factor (sigma-70 family)
MTARSAEPDKTNRASREPAGPDYLALIAQSLAGNERALQSLLRAIEPQVFRLALRMLGNFGDAEDATQEVLVKLTTALASFDGRSAFTTWAYSVTANHMRDVLARRERTQHASLDALQARLDGGLQLTADMAFAQHGVDHAADPLLALEAREMSLRCTQGMLLCLDAEQRLALVLTDVFDLPTAEAAQVAGSSAEAFRQRVSRARRRMEEFLAGRCGLVDSTAPCRCERQVAAKKRVGEALLIEFARAAPHDAPRTAPITLEAARDELSVLQNFARVLHGAPEWRAGERVHARLHEAIRASRLLQRSADAHSGGSA